MGRGSSGISGSGGSGGAIKSYGDFPVSTRIFGGKGASKEDKATKQAIKKDFMADVEVGNVYRVGGGIGSAGGMEFEIVNYNRSPNKMGLKWSGSNRQAVALSSTNLDGFLMNGATLIKKKTEVILWLVNL